MNRVELVMEMMGALQSGDIELAANVIADNFELSGFMSRTLNKNQFLAVQSELLAAMPDFSYNLSDPHREDDDDGVSASIRISGTQTGNLALPLFGLEDISATGLTISLPQTQVTYHVNNEKVVSMTMEARAGSGLDGLLQQISAELSLLPREGEGDIAG